MLLRQFAPVVALLVIAARSQAVPIQITQTFSNVTWYDYGIASGVGYGQTPIGDWIFRGIVDSEAADQIPEYADIAVFQATDVTLTQASLGLDAVGIDNVSYLFFEPDRFGFSFDRFFGAPWTRVIFGTDHFPSGSTLSEYLALATMPTPSNPEDGFGPQWDGFALADGRRLHGWGFAASSTTAAPEPGTFGLISVGLVGLAAGRRLRHRRA